MNMTVDPAIQQFLIVGLLFAAVALIFMGQP
jgi:hypothetical protein